MGVGPPMEAGSRCGSATGKGGWIGPGVEGHPWAMRANGLEPRLAIARIGSLGYKQYCKSSFLVEMAERLGGIS